MVWSLLCLLVLSLSTFGFCNESCLLKLEGPLSGFLAPIPPSQISQTYSKAAWRLIDSTTGKYVEDDPVFMMWNEPGNVWNIGPTTIASDNVYGMANVDSGTECPPDGTRYLTADGTSGRIFRITQPSDGMCSPIMGSVNTPLVSTGLNAGSLSECARMLSDPLYADAVALSLISGQCYVSTITDGLTINTSKKNAVSCIKRCNALPAAFDSSYQKPSAGDTLLDCAMTASQDPNGIGAMINSDGTCSVGVGYFSFQFTAEASMCFIGAGVDLLAPAEREMSLPATMSPPGARR